MAFPAHQAYRWESFSLTHITYPVVEKLLPKFLALLSLTPPFGVCALATATVVYKDVVSAYLLLGSLLSTSCSAILKNLIRQPRPPRYDDDGDAEFGMPSNHSTFAWFCTIFVVGYINRGGSFWAATSLKSRVAFSAASGKVENGCDTTMSSDISSTISGKTWRYLHTQIPVCVALLVAILCSYSRIYLGYHTTNQVVAGSIFGMGLGGIWYRLFESVLVKGCLVWFDAIIYELELARYCESHDAPKID
ncbi:hypothetical protein ACHAXS_012372 [Conticribra weissflogii]